MGSSVPPPKERRGKKGRKTAEGKGNKEKEEKRERKEEKGTKKMEEKGKKRKEKGNKRGKKILKKKERERRGQLPMKSVRQLYHHLATMMNILFLCGWHTIVGQT